MNSNALLVRLEFANDLATKRVPGLGVDLQAAQLLLEQLGLPRPTPEQIEQTRAMMQASTSAAAQSTASMRGPTMTAGAAGGSSGGQANGRDSRGGHRGDDARVTAVSETIRNKKRRVP